MEKIAKYFLILSGAVLLTYALTFLFSPTTLGEIVGFTHHSPNTLVEVTAFYGGLEFGMAVFFIWSGLDKDRFQLALTAYTFIFLSAGIARFIGILLYGFEDPSQPIVTGVEIIFSLFAWWLKGKLE
ncbi:DUF4345 domain-containing protein [Gracilimonas sp.]|uniref:DUF4345 domain-containing protein n=1 Tax=Gracilimonas sp. TaxID=1974203 RepID=UPI0032EBA873